MEQDIRTFSLLFPSENEAFFTLDAAAENDLSVAYLAEKLAAANEEKEKLRKILCTMPVSKSTIAYRQAVYRDLKAFPELSAEMYQIFDQMQFYITDEHTPEVEKSSIWELVSRMRGLQYYVQAVSGLQGLLAEKQFASDGMRELKEYIEKISQDSGFDELAKDLEFLDKGLDEIKSMTLGVNFDNDLCPEQIGILSFHDFRFGEKGLLERFYAFHRKKNTASTEIGSFSMLVHSRKKMAENSPLMNNLTPLVEQMLPSIVRKLKKDLAKYTDMSGTALAKLGDELMFYLRCIDMEKTLTEMGLPCCVPEFSDDDTCFSNLYNVKLALKSKNEDTNIVCNDLEFTRDKTVLILTGPNRGGKTILTQGMGLALLLFQQGVFVPCESAKLRICDGIFTHFPADENQTVTLGRLGEEAARFEKIWEAATSESLVLLNESFASTSHSESLYIAEDVVKSLCCLGVRTVFNTHMHELAENTEQYRVESAVCGAASLIMGKRDGTDAFRIRYEKPNGKSFAHEIAQKFGITFEQLAEKLQRDPHTATEK